MPVYCPSCEAGVDANAKFCLQCGHDLETDGPITATGHDVRQLKELIRAREDLSMAEKFDLIAKVEEGENPIELGLAAPAEGSGITPARWRCKPQHLQWRKEASRKLHKTTPPVQQQQPLLP